MDIFVEQLVRRKRKPSDYIKVFLCFAAAFVVIMLMFAFSNVPYVGSLIFLAAAGLVYLIYNVGISVNLEYEYCFTNGALDVDKIIAARRRKRITDVNARDIEIMATTKNRAFSNYMQNSDIKKIYACSSVQDEGVYFVVYTKDSKKMMLLFNPNETIKDGFRRLNPQKVFLND